MTNKTNTIKTAKLKTKEGFKPSNTFDKENRIGYFQADGKTESIYIGNMSYKMTKLHIQKLFEPFGSVKYVKLVVEPKTNVSKGIAFIQMANKLETIAAIKALNETSVNGRTIKVSLANKQENYTLKPKVYVKTKSKADEEATPVEETTKPMVRRRDKKRGLNMLFNHLNK